MVATTLACRPLVRAHPFIPHTSTSFHQKTTLCMAPSPAFGGGEREKMIGKLSLSFLTASYEHSLLGLWTSTLSINRSTPRLPDLPMRVPPSPYRTL